MKAAVLTGPRVIETQEVETPDIKPNEVLVRLRNCGICTLEQRLYRGDMKIFYPIIPGHEVSGEVAEVGEDVLAELEPGMPVAVDLVMRCGECYYCRTGQSNMCQNRFKEGLRILGGFGEFIVVRGSQVYPVPPEVSFQEAAFTEPVACCIRSLDRIRLELAEDLLIIGAGPMGLIHLQVAMAMGARVFVSDPDNARREMALELGASAAFDPSEDGLEQGVDGLTGGRGADAVVVTSPALAALENAFESLSKTGRINIYTSYGEKPRFPVDANTLHRNEYLITGSEGRTALDFQKAIRLISFGLVNVKSLISEMVPLDDVERGIQHAMSNETYRVLIDHGAVG